jgi:two-component system sensor histidine kinase SenX3
VAPKKPSPDEAAGRLPRWTLATLCALGGYCLVTTPNHKALYVSPLLEPLLTLADGRVTQPELTAIARETRVSGATITRAYHVDNLGELHDVVVQAAVLAKQHVLITLTDRTAEIEATQARHDFVSNIGHELRTPVTAVTLIAQALHASVGDPKAVADFADRLDRVAARLERLTDGMLTLARTQGEPPRQAQDVDVNDIIDRAVTAAEDEAAAAGVKLQRKKRVAAVVRGDADALAAAVENLVINAVHYSTKGSRVVVTAQPDASAGTVTVSVIDQGIGIDPSDQDRVFERFYRTDQGRSQRAGGSGLGLAIVKHTALSHGGSVHVDSYPGAGSTFSVVLPMAASEAAQGPGAP